MSDRREFRELVPPAAADRAIDSLSIGGRRETVPIGDAAGRVLASRIDAEIDVPGFDRAAMDGYAVRARDTFGSDEESPAVLDVIGVVHAGSVPGVIVEPGTAAEISTGAVIPEGADAVVMVERTDPRPGNDGDGDDGPGRVAIRTSVAPGDHIMLAGADIAAGERALGPGTRLTAREIGLLSALGVESVPVRAAPRVGIISTGDELVRPGEPIDHRAGQIYDVNSYTVATAVAEAGGEPAVYPHVGDDYEAMEQVLREAADECDLVVSSGSTSASAVDVIYRVIEDRGELLLHGVAIKPGKPMLVGRLEGSAYVGLPGYPVSALMIFRRFVAPAIRRAAGIPEPAQATVTGRMAVRERYEEGRTRLLPVGLVETGAGDGDGDANGDGNGGMLVYPVDKGSGATTSLVEADGVVEVDADTAYLDAGETVTVRLFSPDIRPPTILGVGEDDPALSRLLDRLDRPRYLALGSREGLRRFRRGMPDVAVAAGPPERSVEAVELGGWRREWGVIVPAGNPDNVSGIGDLVDRPLSFVNRTTNSGLRRSLDAALEDLATERDVDGATLRSAVDGYDRTARAHESPARMVLAGDVSAGLGLRATAESLGLGFVPVGDQQVRVLANPDRTDKPGVRRLEAGVADLDDVLDGLAGFGR